MLMFFILLRPPESIPSTITIASPVSVRECCCCDVSVSWVKTGCTRMLIITRTSMRVAVRLVVGVVSPDPVAVAILLVAISLISITMLVTDPIFSRIDFVL